MERMRAAWVVAAVGMTLIVSPWKASAAHLQKLDETVDKYATPPTADLGGPQECQNDIDQTGAFNISPDGHQASLYISQRINQVGYADTCNWTNEGTFLVRLTFTVQPDPGEAVGDNVTFCLATDFQDVASAAGNYVAQATTTDYAQAGAASVIRNPSGAAVTEFSFGPVTVTQSSAPAYRSSRGEFVAQIGDQIEITVGHHAQTAGAGIGSAAATTYSDITLSLGACSLAPALSQAGLGALVLLLAGLGLFSLHRSGGLPSPTRSGS